VQYAGRLVPQKERRPSPRRRYRPPRRSGRERDRPFYAGIFALLSCNPTRCVFGLSQAVPAKLLDGQGGEGDCSGAYRASPNHRPAGGRGLDRQCDGLLRGDQGPQSICSWPLGVVHWGDFTGPNCGKSLALKTLSDTGPGTFCWGFLFSAYAGYRPGLRVQRGSPADACSKQASAATTPPTL
jgi:hypothetical protein